MNRSIRSTPASAPRRPGLERSALGAGLGALLLLAWSGASGAAELNVVRSLGLSQSDGSTVLTISGSRAPVFTVFKLDSPSRVVIDLPAADLSAVQGTTPGQGAVKQVAASQLTEGKASVGRVVVGLADGTAYDVKAVGERVLVSVHPEASASHAQLAASPVPVAEAPAAPAQVEDPHLVSSRVDEKKVSHPADRVTAARCVRRGQSTRLEVGTDGQVGTFSLIELRDPPRLAIDLQGVKSSARLKVAPTGPIKGVRVGKQAGSLRLVVDATDLTSGSYRAMRTAHGLAVTFGSVPAAEKVAASEAKPAPTPVAVAAVKASEPVKPVRVRDVAFRGDEQDAEVSIALLKPVQYELAHPDPHTAVLTLHGALLPRALERSLDTSAYGGPVKMVSSFVAPGAPGEVQVVATLDEDAHDEVAVGKRGLCWSFKGSDAAEMTLDGRKVDLTQGAVARAEGLEAEAPAYAYSSAPRRPKYTGRRVSFEFKDIDIHNLLRIIAEVSKKNIIVADNVSGKVTIRLRNVPWDQALDIILRSKGLDKEEVGNIVRIAPADELAKERQDEAKRREAERDIEEPKLRLIPVNYADASEIADRVKDVLSKKGSVTVDKRTNVLIVKDVVSSLARVEALVRNLDLQTPQVLIEARIVEANSTFAHEVGVQWGGQVGFAPGFGNPTGLAFPSSAVLTGGASTTTSPGVAAIPNFAVDLPAAVGTGSGAGLGLIFGSAGGAATLNLRITALENSGSAKTISAPKVTTLDNETATISQGVAIPFSQFSASGVNTSFIEAKLELKVRPHVTADGSVMLKIDATNNQPNPGFTGSNGQPSISKKEAHTEVLVKDGDTTVIGGIYTRANALSENTVPIFGKIPLLGWFFRHRNESDTRTELLIFVTPHIVNRQQVVAAQNP